MPSTSSHTPHRFAGFSLVELMVGIVVAMAAVIVVMQVFKVSEGQRRTTTGGDDASTTGAIALSLLQRDLRQAGQGIANPQLMACQLNLGNGRSVAQLLPLQINPAGIPAGDDDTDVLLVSYGSGWGGPEGALIVTQPSAAQYTVGAPQAHQLGDRLIATPATRAAPCALDLTSLSAAPVGNTISVALGANGVAGGMLFNLGRTPRFMAYAVRQGRLTACDFLTHNCASAAPENWTEVADNIVSLRAEYAIDTTAPTRDLVVDSFAQMPPNAQFPGGVCAWSRIYGVRLALVARNRQAEARDLDVPAPTWASEEAPIQLAEGWQRFRYKTFETTVPLRNMPLTFTGCP